jgi:hypothetical protein
MSAALFGELLDFHLESVYMRLVFAHEHLDVLELLFPCLVYLCVP